MKTDISIRGIEHASRAAGLLLALGSLAVVVGLWISYAQLESLDKQVDQLEGRAQSLRAANEELQSKNGLLARQTALLTQRLSESRQALAASRYALEAFHQHDYRSAIYWYDQALAGDPENAYLRNLKAYSLFKLARVEDAIELQRESLLKEPEYAWGYLDLARFECATGDYPEARIALDTAIRLRPDLQSVITRDGELQRLCRPLLQRPATRP